MAPETSGSSARSGSPWALVLCLWALAAVSAVLGLAAALLVLYVDARAWGVGLETILWAVLFFAAGWCMAGVLCALAWLCRSQHRRGLLAGRIAAALERLGEAPVQRSRGRIAGGQAEALRRLGAGDAGLASAEAGKPAPAGAGVELAEASRTPEEDPLLEEIRELNVNVLLSDSQRQMKRRYLTERRTRQLIEEIERGIASGDLGQADESLDRLLRLAPDCPGVEQLCERLEQARAEAEGRDVAEARSRVEELMSVNGFATAEAVVNGLLAKHPSCPEAIALLERVRHEREAFVNEQRMSMYQKVEKHASSRHWRDALSAAEELLSAYPNSPEADAVRVQAETLRENARIEEVRRLRDRVSDLISRRQFAQAIEVARDVIGRFPGTAAAHDLREQMARLEELARAGQEAGK